MYMKRGYKIIGLVIAGIAIAYFAAKKFHLPKLGSRGAGKMLIGSGVTSNLVDTGSEEELMAKELGL